MLSVAIVYSSGYVEVRDLAKAGVVLTVVMLIPFITIGLGWWNLVGVW